MDISEALEVRAHLRQQKELLEKAKPLEGHQPKKAMRRTRAQLEQMFSAERVNAQTNEHQVWTTFIGEAYPPSVEPTSSLKPILLSGLRMEIHHRGRILIVKTFGDPIRTSAIQNAIEDVRGSVDRLSIYNLPRTTPCDTALPKSAIVAVKEPYYTTTADGGVMVRVDHPSDLVLLEHYHSLVPPEWKTSSDATSTTSHYTELGIQAFQERNLQKAVNLKLGQYELASEDAIASVIVGDSLSDRDEKLNVSSYFRAGQAQYQLGNYSLAKKYLDQALGLDPTDEAAMKDLKRTEQRIMEQQSGEFDFFAMDVSNVSGHRRLDHASFTNNTKFAAAGNRGRGLFATKTINRGSVVMVEKAFCVVFEEEVVQDCARIININTGRSWLGPRAECFYEFADKMRRNPHQASKIVDLFDVGKSKAKKVIQVDGSVVVDVFQVQAIAEMNSFACCNRISPWDERENDKESTGIWLHASNLGHSCLPNACGAFIGDMMIVRATRDIKAGDQIFIPYLSAHMLFPQRKDKLSMSWGILCDCALCRVERQLPASVFTDRHRLLHEAAHLMAVSQEGTSNLAKEKDLQRRLHATYDKQMYQALPRLHCVNMDLWMTHLDSSAFLASLQDQAFVEVSPPVLHLSTTIRLLQDMGYKIEVKGSEAFVDRTNGVVCVEVAKTAAWSRIAWVMAGRPRAAKALSELSKDLYLALNGTMDGFDEEFAGLQKKF